MKRVLFFILPSIVVCAATPAAMGQTLHFSETADQESSKITLYPVGEPTPALKHRLLPAMPDLIPGNAAVYYGKVTAEQLPLFSNRELWQKISDWNSTPLEDLRRDEVYRQLQFTAVYYHLARAARCEFCDWQLPIGEEDSYSILLPAAQQLREFSRFLGARARAEIAEGRYADAIRTLEIGYALGRNAAEGETLVNGLVGIAICGIMSRQTLQLIQQPEAPNLYWALSRLPRPMIDLRRAADVEMNAVYWSFPELQDAENSTQDAEYWRRALLALWQKFVPLAGADELWMTKRPEALTALCLRGYPMAKRALVEQGMDPERVEAMPVGQVVAIYTMRTYNELRDDMFKWFYLPYAEGHERARKAEQRLRKSRYESQEVVPLAGMLMPAVSACRAAVARCDREFALLRILEALRIYGATHGGQLPKSLDDVTEVPIPEDPYTGRPFKYTLRGDAALLEGPEGPKPPGLILRLEIRFAK